MPLPTPIIDLSTAIQLGLFARGRSRSTPAYVATSATTNVVFRATAYTEQTTNNGRSLSSNNAADTAAGNGARTVRITYFDQTMAGPFTEIVTLNGTSRVNTANTNICFVQSMEVVTAGSSGSNTGIISIHTVPTSGGSVFGTIAATDNRTYWGHHYVPVSTTAFVTELKTASDNVLGSVTMGVIDPTAANQARQNPMGTVRHGTTTVANWLAVPIIISGPARIEFFVRPAGTGATTHHLQFGVVEV